MNEYETQAETICKYLSLLNLDQKQIKKINSLRKMANNEPIRNAMKRVRKKESSVILASQNIEDFLMPDVKELTKPLFSIPSHHFL